MPHSPRLRKSVSGGKREVNAYVNGRSPSRPRARKGSSSGSMGTKIAQPGALLECCPKRAQRLVPVAQGHGYHCPLMRRNGTPLFQPQQFVHDFSCGSAIAARRIGEPESTQQVG